MSSDSAAETASMGKPETLMSRLACQTCRRQKRKCTRELPSCQLCLTNQRHCSYPSDSNTLVYDAPEQNTESPSSVYAGNSFPPLFFLDSELFTTLNSRISLSGIRIPKDLQDLASCDDEYLGQLAEQYFQSTHGILPFVCKQRIKHSLAMKSREADLLLLLLCMIAVSQPGEPTAYERGKYCLYVLESQGLISIRVLQAAILLAWHEISNAIYPAAFLTVAHCARLGQAMGIHDRRNAPQLFPGQYSWVEFEQARRTWWAVFILDRFVSIGVDNSHFASRNPKPEELLPVNEAAWERGETVVAPSLAVTADTSFGASVFARTCQASHVLSLVLSHIHSNSIPEDRRAYYQDALQLHKVVASFHAFLFEEAMNRNPLGLATQSSALGICSSALVALCYAHSCAEFDDPAGQGTTEQLSMQKISIEGLHKFAPIMCEFATKLTTVLQSNEPGAVADMFVVQSFYATAKLCLWYCKETGGPEYLSYVNILKGALQTISQRLRVATEYLSILERDIVKLL